MGEARRYEELAEFARANEFRNVTGPAVQHWTKRGLVPRAAIVHYAFGRRAITFPTETGRQLLELCAIRFREHVRDLDSIALRLWTAGFPLDSNVVRRALAHAGDVSRFERFGRALSARRGDPPPSQEEAVGVAADRLNEELVQRGIVARPLDAVHFAAGLADYVAAALRVGVQTPVDQRGLEVLGAVAGLTAEDVEQLPSVAVYWDPDHLRERLDSATEGQLLAARSLAVSMVSAESGQVIPMAALVPAGLLAGLVALAFLVLRDFPLAAAALVSHEQAPDNGARALRYLR